MRGYGSQVTDFLKKYKIKGKIAVACSGGVDSMALGFLLAESNDVVALIVDHGLRKASAAEAKKASKILDKLGIENVILKKKNNIKANLQEEARKLRYELLLEYCKKHRIKYLATAHHAEDNAETFLLRLSRGSGLDGLSAIAPISEMNGIRLIRPVLQISKKELAAVLWKNKIGHVEDPTNRTDKYQRNKLRLALGKLEDGELIMRRINDAAENLARVRDFVEVEVEKAFAACTKLSPSLREGLGAGKAKRSGARHAPPPNLLPEGGGEIKIAKFSMLHDEIAYRVLVKLIMQLSKSEKKPRFEKLKRLKTDLLNGQVRTLNGLIFRPKANKIIITIEKSSR